MTLKARLQAGETLFGTFLTLGSPLAAEALGLAGFDWLLVDLEHGGGHEAQLLPQLMACTAAGVPALVRVESHARERATRALDLGADGVMCPQVNSGEAATAWAANLHYKTGRGVALAHRGARYGTVPIDAADPLGIAQIESPEAVDNVEAIANADGIDVLFVGPTDLSFSLGCFRSFDDPRYREAIERVLAAGKPAGIFCASVDEVPRALADGFRMIAIGTDAGLMLRAAREARSRTRDGSAGC